MDHMAPLFQKEKEGYMRGKFRVLTIMVTAFVMIFVFTGCGDSAKSVRGETFDGGNIEVFVPEGWKAFHGADTFGDYDEGYDPNVVSIGKGADSELDLFSKPMMHITYSGKNRTLSMPSKELYKDGKDIEDIRTDDHTWRGYTATSVGYPIAVLFTEDGDEQIQVAVTLENGDEKISLEDADVLAILEGIKVKK